MNVSSMKVQICRLCLQPVHDGNFHAIDNFSRKMLNVLLLELDLDVSKQPVMCYECAALLQNCFDFKSTCVSLENRTLPHIKSEQNDLTLEDVHFKQENMELDISGDQKMCHFCLKQNQQSLLLSLNESKGNMFMANVIQQHIPEMNMGVTQEILTCEICIDSIKNLSNFVTCCLDVEEKIKTYNIPTERAGDGNYLDLHKIQQFKLTMIDCKSNCPDLTDSVIKDSCNDTQDITVKTEIKAEDIDTNELEFKVDEDLKTDPDQNDYKRNLDTIFLPCSYKDEYEDYISASSSATQFTCEVCPFKAEDEERFNDHVLMHNIEIYECDHCPYKGIKSNLRKHLLSHKHSMEVRMYRCDTCGFESKYNSVVKKHTLVHRDPSEIAMHKCELCSYEGKRKDSLKVHMLSHRKPSEIPIYKCDVCGQGVKYKKSLVKHMLTHKDTSEITVYKCVVCTYKSKHKSDLKKHVKAVHGGI